MSHFGGELVQAHGIVPQLLPEQYFMRPYVDANNRFSFGNGSGTDTVVINGRTVTTATTLSYNQDVEIGARTATHNLYHYRNYPIAGVTHLVFDVIKQIGASPRLIVTQRVGSTTTTKLDTTDLSDTEFTRFEVAIDQPSANGDYYQIFLQNCGIRFPPELGLGKYGCAVFL